MSKQTPKKIVLVVAAHPDDEILGCGGTVARHAMDGDDVHVLILGEGITSRGQSTGENQEHLSDLAIAAQKANAALGVTSLEMKNLPDNRLDSLDRLDVIKIVEAKVAAVKPEIVYTHHVGDVNVDHSYAHEAVITACRPTPGHPVKALLFFETASSTEWRPSGSGVPFIPNWFVDISAAMARKTAALEAYAGEMRPWPHARSIEAVKHLAKWRGATIGVDAAEAFILGRSLR